MKKPALSIVTMSKSYGRYLPEWFKAIDNQTCQDFEVLLVNPSATDNTRDFAQDADQYFEIRDMGLGSSRDYAIQHAKGEYVCTIDADDLVEPTFVEKMLEQAAPRTIVCPGVQQFEGSNLSFVVKGPFTHRSFVQGNKLLCCSLYHRRDYLAVGGYDPELDWLGFEDWLLWTDLVLSGCEVKVVPELLFKYRVHGGSNSSVFSDRHHRATEYIRRKHAIIY